MIKVKKPSYMQKTARCIQRFLFDVYIYAAMVSRAEPNDPLYLNEQVLASLKRITKICQVLSGYQDCKRNYYRIFLLPPLLLQTKQRPLKAR